MPADYDDLDFGTENVAPITDRAGPEVLADGDYNFLIEKADDAMMKTSAKYPRGGVIINLSLMTLTPDGKEGPKFRWSHWLGKGDREDMGRWFGFLIKMGFVNPNEWAARGGLKEWQPKALKALKGIVFHAKKNSYDKDKGGKGHALNGAARLDPVHTLDTQPGSIGFEELEAAWKVHDADVPF